MRVVGGMAVSFAAARAAMCTLPSTLDRRPYTWNLSFEWFISFNLSVPSTPLRASFHTAPRPPCPPCHPLQGYRRLLHECPGYATFLKALMSTKTLLYVGFSFTDDYLNEFRSEIVSMLRPNEQSITHDAVSATTQPTVATAAAMSGDRGSESREEFIGRMRKIGAEREMQKGGLYNPEGYSPEPSGGPNDAGTDAAITAVDGRGGSQVTIAGDARSSGEGGDGGETKDQTQDETEDETQGGGSRPRTKSTTFMDMDDGVGVVARPVNTLAYVSICNYVSTFNM